MKPPSAGVSLGEAPHRAAFEEGERKRQNEWLREMTADRNRWVRLFNRLQGAVQHHRDAGRFKDDHDEALYAAMDRVLRDVAQGKG